MLTAIAGINWGDEGKGRMVDLLSKDYDIIVRYQGGNNAGHTVINENGKFILNLLPSGILRASTINVMGNGMVIDIEHLAGEIKSLTDRGVQITPENLKISDKAVICMPYHRLLDNLEEDRLGDKQYGSTRRGIAPVYGDKYMKKVVRMGDLKDIEKLKGWVADLVQWKNLMIEKGYGHERISADACVDWLRQYGALVQDYVCDLNLYLTEAAENGKKIMFEAQLGALRDIDFGIFPYTTSSSTIASYAPIGAGIPAQKLDHVIGVMKAYSSCVGEGPFTAELFGEEGDELREAGGEYGATTGRPRRVGGFDIPASRYGVRIQGADSIALTKLDVLSGLGKIPVCIAYDCEGERTEEFPIGSKLENAKPIYEYLEGFSEDISKCRRLEELPQAAIDYVKYIEQAVGCPIKYISVGANREDYIAV